MWGILPCLGVFTENKTVKYFYIVMDLTFLQSFPIFIRPNKKKNVLVSDHPSDPKCYPPNLQFFFTGRNRDRVQIAKSTSAHRKKNVYSGLSGIKFDTNNVTPKTLYVLRMFITCNVRDKTFSSTFQWRSGRSNTVHRCKLPICALLSFQSVQSAFAWYKTRTSW